MSELQSLAAAVAMLAGLWASPFDVAQSTQSSASTGERLVVPFSDPSRPGTLRVRMIQGNVTIKASSGRDAVITATGARLQRPQRERDRARTDGLRRLDQPSGFGVQEDNNVISVNTRPQDEGHITVEVPAKTNLQVSVVNGEGVTVEGIEGEIEVNSVNGGITLTNVAGAVVAHSVSGNISATLRQLGNSPLAFTSLNGDVDVTLPGATKATLRMRSDLGEIYTDFDVQTTAAPASSSNEPTRRSAERRQERDRDGDKEKGKFRLDVNRGISGTINGGGIELELRTFNGDVFLRRAK